MASRPLRDRATARRHARNLPRPGRATPAAVSRSFTAIIRGHLPRAGMIYPFEETLMQRRHSDVAIFSAICRSHPGSLVTTRLLNDVFSRIFEEATELLPQYGGMFNKDPIAFMRLLRGRPALRDVWMRRSADLFASVFVILRAARKAWFEDPRPPFETNEHCKLARAIDAFLEVDTLDWSSLAIVEWIMRDALACRGEEDTVAQGEAAEVGIEVPADDGNDSEDDGSVVEIILSDDDADDAMEVDEQATSSGAALQMARDKTEASMRRLHIPIDEDVLAQALNKLNLGSSNGGMEVDS